MTVPRKDPESRGSKISCNIVPGGHSQFSSHVIYIYTNKKNEVLVNTHLVTSLAVQGLRLCSRSRSPRVRSPLTELDPTHHKDLGAAKELNEYIF